jgi:hypothetical protein
MSSQSARYTRGIITAALIVALAVIFVLWGVRGLSLISASLAGIVVFLASAVALSVIVAVMVGVAGRREAGRSRS